MSTTFYNWDSAQLGLGIHEMDEEHQVLISLMNKLYEKEANGASKNELSHLLQDLLGFTKRHFSNEEKLMETIQYPKYSIHKVIHQNLIKNLEEFVRVFQQGNGHLGDDFHRFLKVWLTDHIRGIDRQYGQFYKGKAA